MAHVSDQEIKKLATLSALALKADQVHGMAETVQSVLSYAQSLAQVDINGQSALDMAMVPRTCWMRPDVAHPWNGVNLLEQAPDSDGTFFIVPVIIKQD